MHDSIHAADTRVMHEIVHLDASSFTVKSDRLYHSINADLISKLKTIGQGLFRAVNAHADTIEVMNIHTCRKCLAGEAIGLDWWIIQAGFLYILICIGNFITAVCHVNEKGTTPLSSHQIF